jgi:predicted dehydrogenase
VARVQALAGIGYPERIVTAESPQRGKRIAVETPTSLMALLEFRSGAQVTLVMSWDVWRHGHPPIELYGTEGSMRVPDPNFFGGIVELTERGGDWRGEDAAGLPLGAPNWRSPNWPADAPLKPNYRGLGVADLADAARRGIQPRCGGTLALHVLEVMQAIIEAGVGGRSVAIATPVERPAALEDADAAALWTADPARA